MNVCDAYDEFPYKCLPIEWTSPERLTLASLLHGGPRQRLEGYRVLELGCGDGANLLPLAYHRPGATFVGVDGAVTQIDAARAAVARLGLSNIEFVHADFLAVNRCMTGKFDFILAHGIFSWVSHAVRDSLFVLCAERLRRGGLLYLNYNCHPGWKVRGLVREFLLAQTATVAGLRSRTRSAQEVAARMAASLSAQEHPYSRLMADEFDFVSASDPSYVAHEYLAADNHPYWRSEFLALARQHGFEYVADADFCYHSRQVSQDLAFKLVQEQVTGRALDDTVDLLSYRQLHSPILTQHPLRREAVTAEEFAGLHIASCLAPCDRLCTTQDAQIRMFQHPSGFQVEAKEDVMWTALEQLQPLWPRGMRVDSVFSDVAHVMEDLQVLQRNGLIELRCNEPVDVKGGTQTLATMERNKGGYFTTPYHTREPASAYL